MFKIIAQFECYNLDFVNLDCDLVSSYYDDNIYLHYVNNVNSSKKGR